MAQQLTVKSIPLKSPSLVELATVLEDGLRKAFAECEVKVVDCPNLTEPPFTLACEGICGRTRIADIGGVKNLLPLPNKEKIYNLDSISQLIDLPGAFMIGAGGGPFHHVGVNSEFMANIRTKNSSDEALNKSYIAKLNSESKECELLQMPESKDFGLMLNILASEGKPGKVLQVKAAKRLQETNLVTCMREALNEKYGEDPVGLGGVFLIQKGKAKLHIMPEFSSTPLDDVTVNDWLKYFNMKAILICLSVFVSHDPGLDLRVEHTHCFSHHGEGGHYHYDTTPNEIEYLGYFVPAETLYRVDQPE